jgi:transcriptional regulator GlxA family with amidase domain
MLSGRVHQECNGRVDERDLGRPRSLAELARASGCSPAAIARSCLVATGMPPMRRLKQVRLEIARGVVKRSGIALGTIARQVGYAPVHEFSRDYRKLFGSAPSHDRRDA